jgi:hypothetical protein
LNLLAGIESAPTQKIKREKYKLGLNESNTAFHTTQPQLVKPVRFDFSHFKVVLDKTREKSSSFSPYPYFYKTASIL